VAREALGRSRGGVNQTRSSNRTVVRVNAPNRVAADKAYGSRAFRTFLRRRGIRGTLPRKSNERRRGAFDKDVYRQRNQVERFFNRLKQNRRIATRYEKRAVNYLAMITLACILMWL